MVQHIEYVPFGEVFIEERNNTWNTPYLFNAKELDEETGLYYYGARYYDPRASVWLSVDPIASYNPFEKENFIDGQHNGGVYNSYNNAVYGYCYQNPIRLVDPNGKQASSLNYGQGFNVSQQDIQSAYNHQTTGWIGDTTADKLKASFYQLAPAAIIASIGVKVAAILGVEGKVSFGWIIKGKDAGPHGYASGNIGVTNDLGMSANLGAEMVYPQGNPEAFKGSDIEGTAKESSISVSKGPYTGSVSVSEAQSKDAGKLKGYGAEVGVGKSVKNILPFTLTEQKNTTKGFRTNSYKNDSQKK